MKALMHGWKLAVLIIVAVLIFLWLIKASVMSLYISDRLGIPVTMRTISMWPSTTWMRYFKIENPDGYHPETALEIKKVDLHYQFGELTGHPSIIDSILLDEIILNIEIRNRTGSDNNWAALGSMVHHVKSSREVLVHKLILKNITVNVTGKGAETMGLSGTKHFDQMEFNNVNSKEGFPTKQLVGQIFEGIGFKRFIDNFLNPTERIKKTLNPFNIFGKKSPRETEGLDIRTED